MLSSVCDDVTRSKHGLKIYKSGKEAKEVILGDQEGWGQEHVEHERGKETPQERNRGDRSGGEGRRMTLC